MQTATPSKTQDPLQAFARLLGIMQKLRNECPWDRQQTMESLRHLTIEETYELSEAIMSDNSGEVKEELGDLLLHIVLHSLIAAEEKKFTITEVINTLCDKLIYRHPHIYGTQTAKDSKAVQENWEKLKLQKSQDKSVLSGVPKALPSLLKAVRIREKTRRAKLDWQDQEAAWDDAKKGMEAFIQQVNQEKNTSLPQSTIKTHIGHLILALVNYASLIDINTEDALEEANEAFINKVRKIENKLASEGKRHMTLSPQELKAYWQ